MATATMIEPTELEANTAALADRMLAAADGHTTVERLMALSHALAHVVAGEHEVKEVDRAYGAAVQMLRLRVALLTNQRIDQMSRREKEMLAVDRMDSFLTLLDQF